MKVTRLFLTFALILIASVSFAQNIKVTGQVTDAETGEPVAFANLMVVGTTTGTATDIDGLFTINADKNASLIFSMIGYEDITVPVAGKSIVNVQMQPSTTFLEESVVSALGITRAAKSLTYSAQTVNSDELTTNRTSNMISALAGKAAGVTITQSAAGMGGSTNISIRGFRSVNSGNSPLIVVNGVPIGGGSDSTGDTYGTGGFASYDRGDGLGNINPEDIESISILKGASASALYGTEAANGVILITTKKGSAGKFNITVSNNTTFETAAYKPELQDAYGHTADWRSWGAPLNGKGVKAIDNFFKTAPTINTNVVINGGTEKNQTYFSYANTQAYSMIDNGGSMGRHNITLRNTTYFRPNFSLDASVQLIKENVKNRPTTGGIYHNPLISIYQYPADGVQVDGQTRYMDYWKENFEVYNPDRNLMAQNWYSPLGANDTQNPYWIMNRILTQSWRTRVIASANLKWDVNDKVYLQVRGNVDYSGDRHDDRAYATTTPGIISSENGLYSFGSSQSSSYYGDFLAGYKNKWGNFGLNATIGTSIKFGEDYSTSTSSRGAGGELRYANIFAIGNIASPNLGQSWYKSELIGLFATATLSFKDWLFLDITGRNDWSSTLAYSTSFKSGFFYPSVGLSASLNDAFQMAKWVDLLKVRVSYAVVGNDLPSRVTNPLGSVSSTGTVTSNTTAPFGELKPELSSSIEAGIDFRVLNNRLSLDFTWYKTNTKNQLFSLNAPAGSGYSTYYVNSGNIENIGFEGTLGFVPVERKNFTWRSSINFAHNDNTVISLNDEIKSYTLSEFDNHGYAMKLTEGGKYGDVYGRKFARDAQGKLLLDGKGLPYKEEGAYGYVGNTEAKFTAGWNNNFQIGNVNVAFLVDARFGGLCLDSQQADLDGWGVSKATADARDKGYVEFEGQKFTDVEAFYKRVGTFEGITEAYFYDATNIRLREASIGYTFPSKIFGNVLKGVSVSAVGRNLFFFYKKAPYDPDSLIEVGSSKRGFNFYGMPAARTFGFNVKLTF